ncbi:hypothetical protein [Methanococcus maripaludis]|uniref:Uncharacterized protein n=1 Tax=Methanococcus maripaludis TaxID=39152 RepID=A0A7J9PH08_METMI|nr:hypothetical protein [Methanococcus maripaludis]MBA2862048.1 hypothetical protein [Methanococcus maripaludis]
MYQTFKATIFPKKLKILSTPITAPVSKEIQDMNYQIKKIMTVEMNKAIAEDEKKDKYYFYFDIHLNLSRDDTIEVKKTLLKTEIKVLGYGSPEPRTDSRSYRNSAPSRVSETFSRN